MPKKLPVMTKLHFQIMNRDGCQKTFRKYVYLMGIEPNYAVVQYIGDASAAEDLPHG
jgi:hypothetical protein